MEKTKRHVIITEEKTGDNKEITTTVVFSSVKKAAEFYGFKYRTIVDKKMPFIHENVLFQKRLIK